MKHIERINFGKILEDHREPIVRGLDIALAGLTAYMTSKVLVSMGEQNIYDSVLFSGFSYLLLQPEVLSSLSSELYHSGRLPVLDAMAGNGFIKPD